MAKPSLWWLRPTFGEWLYLLLGLTLGAACALFFQAATGQTELPAAFAPWLGALAAVITASIGWRSYARGRLKSTTERRARVEDDVLATCVELAELLRSVAKRDVEGAAPPGRFVSMSERFPMLYQMVSDPEPLQRLTKLRPEVQELFPAGTDACLAELVKLHAEMKSTLDYARMNAGDRELPSEQAYKRMEPVMGQPGLDRIDTMLGAIRDSFRTSPE